jgi:hypothetical protein
VTSARILHVRRHALRPPLVALAADIALRNDGGQPRWWLVAGTAGPGTDPVGKGGVHSVEVAPSDGVIVARFAGAAPFGALRLDAGDEVTLREWTVTVWDDPPVSTVDVDVVSAAEVIIGGSPIAEWLERGTWPGENLELFAVDLVDPCRETVEIAA